MLKRELISEELHDAAYAAINRNFDFDSSDWDELAGRLGRVLLLATEAFIDEEVGRQEREKGDVDL